MAGILDFLNSPDAQLGIGLLAAGGPTTDPNRSGLGQRIAGALQGVTANQAAMTDAQLKKAQLADELQKTQVNAFQLKRLQDWQNMVTGGDTSGGASGVSPTGASPSMTAQASGVVPPAMGAGAPSNAGMSPGDPSQAAPQQAAAPGFRYALPGVGDQQSRAIAAILPPADYMKMYADKAGPQTDIAKMMVDAGIDRNSPLGRQLVQTAIAKANNVPPTSVRPGGYTLDNLTGVATQYPHVPDGSQAVSDGQGGWRIVPVQGGYQGMQAGARATAQGKGDIETKQVWDPTYTDPATGRKGGYVNQTVTNIANAANPQSAPQASPAPAGYSTEPQMRATAQGDMGFDPKAAMREIQATQQQLAASPNLDPQSKAMLQGHIADMQRQLSNTPAQPASQTAPGPQIASNVAPTVGPMPSAPPLGTGANADAAEKSSAQTMRDSYSRLQSGNSSANAALDALNKMQVLGARKNAVLQSGPLMAGPLGTVQTSISPEAAEYEKQRANVTALLANQQGTNGSDAGRALTGQSVPDFGKPKAAIQDGLETLKNQTVAQQLKTNLLTPLYQAGDSKGYTKLENEFDQNVSPSMVPVLTMPPGQSRNMLLQSLRQKPGMEAKLNWAVQNGLLK